jgi:hypothetical protein
MVYRFLFDLIDDLGANASVIERDQFSIQNPARPAPAQPSLGDMAMVRAQYANDGSSFWNAPIRRLKFAY